MWNKREKIGRIDFYFFTILDFTSKKYLYMKKFIPLILLLSLSLGCAPKVYIQTNKAEKFNEKISTLFVLIRLHKNAHNKYSENFKAAISEELKTKGIPYEIGILNSLSLGTEYSLTKDKKKEGGVITIRQQGWSGKFDIKLFMPGQRDPVWRANLTSIPASVPNAKLYYPTIAKKLILNLEADNLF